MWRLTEKLVLASVLVPVSKVGHGRLRRLPRREAGWVWPVRCAPRGLGVPVCPLAARCRQAAVAGRERGGCSAELICACSAGRFRQTSVGAVTARRRNALPVFPLWSVARLSPLDLRCHVRCPCAASMRLLSGAVTGSTRQSQFLTLGSTPTSAGKFFLFIYKEQCQCPWKPVVKLENTEIKVGQRKKKAWNHRGRFQTTN